MSTVKFDADDIKSEAMVILDKVVGQIGDQTDAKSYLEAYFNTIDELPKELRQSTIIMAYCIVEHYADELNELLKTEN